MGADKTLKVGTVVRFDCASLITAAITATDEVDRAATLFCLRERWSMEHPHEGLKLRLPPIQPLARKRKASR